MRYECTLEAKKGRLPLLHLSVLLRPPGHKTPSLRGRGLPGRERLGAPWEPPNPCCLQTSLLKVLMGRGDWLNPFPRPQPSASSSSPSQMGDEVEALGEYFTGEKRSERQSPDRGEVQGRQVLGAILGAGWAGPGVCPHLRGEFSPWEGETFLFSALLRPFLARGTKEG